MRTHDTDNVPEYEPSSAWNREHGERRENEPWIYRVLDRLFNHEVIDGGGRCEYLHRWHILKLWSGRGIYLHNFVDSDWSYDFHDHPKRFVSIGLKGSYIEHQIVVVNGEVFQKRVRFKAPWIRSFPAKHVHRLELDSASCWTLVCVGKIERAWGFWFRKNGRYWWQPWKGYVKSEQADRAKIC